MKQGTARGRLKDRKQDLYETPTQAILTLLRNAPLPQRIWEPCCGPGAIVKPLRASGRIVEASDLIDYGERSCPDSVAGRDFLLEQQAPAGFNCIVTNPPFMLADEFVRHGLQLVDRVIVLQRLVALEGERRSDLIDRYLAHVMLGRERLPMMHRDGWAGTKIGNSGAPFAWFFFDRHHVGGGTTLRRVSWREAA